MLHTADPSPTAQQPKVEATVRPPSVQPPTPDESAPEVPLDTAPVWRWLLGPLGRERLAIKRTLLAVGILAMTDVWRHAAALAGYASLTEVHWLAAYDAVFLLSAYWLLRSGRTKGFRDPAMTVAQCMLGTASIAVSYVIVPDLRGVQVSMLTAALLFTAFMPNPAHCRLIGAWAWSIFLLAAIYAGVFRPATFNLRTELLNLVVALFATPVFALLATQLSRIRNDLKTQRRELRAAMARIESLAILDELTALPNRRRALELMTSACATAERRALPLTLAYIDIDNFKRINDTHGHAAGDQVLRTVASLAASFLRSGDLIARWGGEEFLLILPATTVDEGKQVIDRLRQHMDAEANWRDRPLLKVTFSAGAAQRWAGEPAEHALERADRALYRAKAAGRALTMVADHSV